MLAERLLSSKTQAYAIVCSLALLSLFFKPLGILVGASVTLIALGINLASATLLGVVSTILIALTSFALGSFVALDAIIYAGLFIAPVLLGSALIRHQMGLSNALLGIALWVGLAVIIARLWYGDLNDIWLPQLEALIQEMALDEGQASLDIIKTLITASMAFVVFLLSCCGMLLGGKWHSAHSQNAQCLPFYQLQYGAKVALLMTVIAVMAYFGSQIALDLSGIVFALLMLQGLALIHYLLQAKALSSWWVLPVYLVILMIPEAFFLIAIIGLIDNWMHLRKYMPMQA